MFQYSRPDTITFVLSDCIRLCFHLKKKPHRYNSDSAHGTLINYFSDDERKDNEGAKLGTATADNTRMLQERRFLYKDIGDESQACPQNFGDGAQDYTH